MSVELKHTLEFATHIPELESNDYKLQLNGDVKVIEEKLVQCEGVEEDVNMESPGAEQLCKEEHTELEEYDFINCDQLKSEFEEKKLIKQKSVEEDENVEHMDPLGAEKLCKEEHGEVEEYSIDYCDQLQLNCETKIEEEILIKQEDENVEHMKPSGPEKLCKEEHAEVEKDYDFSSYNQLKLKSETEVEEKIVKQECVEENTDVQQFLKCKQKTPVLAKSIRKQKICGLGDVNNQFNCLSCNEQYSCSRLLRTHLKLHIGVEPYECLLCKKKYKKRNTLFAHLLRHYEPKPYKCATCGKYFSHKHSLTTHLHTHTGNKPFMCEICEKSFTRKYELNVHIQMHAGIKSYKCKMCGKGFVRKSHLTVHLRTHSGVKPFRCETCGKCFSYSHTFTNHLQLHTGIKPHNCEICGKGYSQRYALNRHLLTHANIKPHTCETCGKGFTKKFYLNVHTRVHMNSNAKPAENVLTVIAN